MSWRHFLKGGFFLCDNSSLCHTKPVSTPSIQTYEPLRIILIKTVTSPYSSAEGFPSFLFTPWGMLWSKHLHNLCPNHRSAWQSHVFTQHRSSPGWTQRRLKGELLPKCCTESLSLFFCHLSWLKMTKNVPVRLKRNPTLWATTLNWKPECSDGHFYSLISLGYLQFLW